jgi:3-deoxy-D-manno-octulosonic-acid transferase
MRIGERLGWWLYQATMAASLLGVAPYLLVRRGRHYLDTLPGRLGMAKPGREDPVRKGGILPTGGLWIHAVSVGEVGVAATLVRALPQELPLVVTTVTPTGQERARASFLKAKGGNTAAERAVAYLPFDLGFAVDRFFDRFSPSALILVEGDYWPLVLREARRRQIPVAVVNGRVGKTSGARLKRVSGLARRLFFSAVGTFGVQTEEDRQLLIAGGAEAKRIHITGNLKYDTPRPVAQNDLAKRVRDLAEGRPILVAGSTMEGEEEQVLEAFRRCGGGERALLILAPRHPERCNAVARLVEAQGFVGWRRSRLGDGESEDERRTEVLLLDSLGELAPLYAVATLVFIGGTLVPTGGHNPLEPAHFAVPTVVGPSMENFHEMAKRFDSADAWRRAADAVELAQRWEEWLQSPEEGRSCGRRAAELLEANRGALGKTLEILAPLVDTVRAVKK